MFNFTDVTNQANFLFANLKEIIEKLQKEKNYLITQVEKLQIEKSQIAISNKSLINKVELLQIELRRKTLPLV